MNRQEAFDIAARQMQKQGWQRCLAPTGDKCAYQNGGMRCAVGALLESPPPSSYFGLIFALYEDFPETRSLIKELGTRWLTDLQCQHDHGTNANEMKNNFKHFAAAHNLTLTEGVDFESC